MAEEQDVLNRWRLVLGKYAANRISFGEGSIRYMDMEDVLDYLYSREYGEEQDIRQERGGNGDSQLTVPAWLHQMKRLFPRETVEIMERHALEKYQMTELLTDPEVLGRLEPNRELLKTILGLKHLMKGFVINRFRGDGSILRSGIERIEELTGMKCLGVLPYENLRFPEEDSLSSSEGKLEGTDTHAAFLSNLDEMTKHAMEAGFDFDALVEFASQ